MVFMMLENVKKTFFLLLFLFIGIQIQAQNKEDDAAYLKYTDEITNAFIQESEKEYNLECIGTGGRLARNIAGISIRFIARQKGTIEQARFLEVNMTENLLKRINTHEKIRPFLAEYPFPVKDINISIAFRKPDDSCYSDGSVVLIFQAHNKLFYDREDPKTEQLVKIMEEPYEEALKIVNSQPSETKSSDTLNKLKT